MIKKNFNYCKGIYVVTIISILFTASELHAEERPPASKALSEKTKEFLSDPARTGSLVGSILAGAAVPNPLAPVLGSMVGFLIGKSSAFSNKDSNSARQQAYANRSLIPEDGIQVTGLTGLTGKQPQTSEQPLIVGLSEVSATGNQTEQIKQTITLGMTGETGTENQSEQTGQIVIVGSTPVGSAIRSLSTDTGMGNQSQQTEQTVNLGLTGNTGAGSNLPQQLASACGNMQLTQPLSLGCYYYSQ